MLLNASFKEESSIEDVTLSSENKVVSEEVFNNIMLNSDEIDSYVSEYNLDNRFLPASTFKVLEYVDSNTFYKVRIVNVYVDFDINNNPVYTFNDAFSDEYLFSMILSVTSLSFSYVMKSFAANKFIISLYTEIIILFSTKLNITTTSKNGAKGSFVGLKQM